MLRETADMNQALGEEGLEVLIFKKAEDQELNPAIIAHQYQLPISSTAFWWKPQEFNEVRDVYANVDILSGSNNVVSRYIDNLAAVIKFPRSTAYLHSLGVVSSIMVEHFFYKFGYGHENTVALYTVGAQPPSTGKSGINNYLTKAARDKYAEKAKENAIERAKIERKIAKLEAEIKNKKTSDSAIDKLTRDLFELQDELKKYPNYKFSSNNPTPEGCEKLATRNNGWCNVLSAESAAVKVVLGVVYGTGAGTANNNIFLSMWDNEYLSIDRSSREGFDGEVRGAVCILAQPAAIQTILEAGQGGEGISERFLMIKEKSLLGSRDHNVVVPFDAGLHNEYEKLIGNIASTNWKIVFSVANGAETYIRDIRNEYEPLMGPGGKYSSPLMQGVIGKADKQILKIASVLHCIDNWCDGGKQGKEISLATVRHASMMFNQLLSAYDAAADSSGYTGEITELQKIVEVLTKYAGKGKFKIDVRKLRDAIKNLPQFSGDGLTAKIKSTYIPKLERHAYLVFDEVNGDIFINPWLRA